MEDDGRKKRKSSQKLSFQAQSKLKYCWPYTIIRMIDLYIATVFKVASCIHIRIR